MERRAIKTINSFSLSQEIIFYILLIVLLLFSTPLAFCQIVVTSPSIREIVKSCAEYADEVLYDRWDMNERTDLGWRIYNTYELPLSYLENISFSGGIFSARSGYTPGLPAPLTSDVNITILDSAYPNAVVIGKTGKKYPINADKYTILGLRMYIEPDVEGKIYGQGYLYWSKNTIYNGISTAGPFFARDGWYFYFINIPTLSLVPGSDSWSGWIDSLRMDPIAISNKEIRIDWIRLVENDSSTQKTISWTGNQGAVDIYLDNDNNSANGNLGALAKDVSGTSYTFLAGGLAPGDYYVAIAPAGTNSYSYSAGYYHINDTPILCFQKPSEEGSDTDFATVSFGDPWDMVNSQDVEYMLNVRTSGFQTLTFEDIRGNIYSNQSVFYGESEPASGFPYGDPIVYFLFPWFGKRGTWTSIDTIKYHNLIFKMGILGTYSYNDGSIARVIWKREDEAVENVSKDIVIRHFPDRWMVEKIVCDLRTIPLEEGAGSPSHSGWTGLVNAFRIDPLEFPDSKPFIFDDVRLTADWTASDAFTIEWALDDDDSSLTLSLYYDSDNSGYDGSPIALNISVSPGTGSYTWNTSIIPDGKYWIYAVISDGLNANRAYATGPLIVDHGLIPVISLSKRNLYFGGIAGGVTTSKQTVIISNAGQGALNWRLTKSASWIEVSPASGSGNAVLEVQVNVSGLSPGEYSGTITVTDLQASNSPQIINVYLAVAAVGGSSMPFGCFDTPIDGASGIEGAIPVTGWVLDDIEVIKVEIKRDPHPLDNPVVIGDDGLVYIGDGVFVEGARPDVEQTYPTYPLNYRAGWGYMLLTNFLPNQGNGTYRLHAIAYDKEGHRVELGSKTFTSDNAHATYPFGTIDTPSQGGTVSGSSYVNFAWALTPQPKIIPTDGSTILVWIDGVPQPGHPVYNQYRSDIATLFPGYANSNGAVGYYYIDTTRLTNGVHTLAWSVVDSAGKAAGIGSRYFTVLNTGGTLGSVEGSSSFIADKLGNNIRLRSRNDKNQGSNQSLNKKESIRDRILLSSLYGENKGAQKTSSRFSELSLLPLSWGPVYVLRGYDLRAVPEAVFPEADGWIRVEMDQAGRLELMLDEETKDSRMEELRAIALGIGQDLQAQGTEGSRGVEEGILKQDAKKRGTFNNRANNRAIYAAYLVLGDELRPLPIGSFFDPERGIFFWQPGPAFIDAYDFVFIMKEGSGLQKKAILRIIIQPR